MPQPWPVVIVAGLPRSGTSLLMQMLQAGGAPLLMDQQRPADANNPHGYFEFAPVKKLREDSSWLSQASGKVVKVVSPLLADLPRANSYRVLLIERSLPEVLASQQQLRASLSGSEPSPSVAELTRVYTSHQTQTRLLLDARDELLVHNVNHAELLASPATLVPAIISGIVAFLQPAWPELKLNEGAMLQAIDRGLYRVRR